MSSSGAEWFGRGKRGHFSSLLSARTRLVPTKASLAWLRAAREGAATCTKDEQPITATLTDTAAPPSRKSCSRASPDGARDDNDDKDNDDDDEDDNDEDEDNDEEDAAAEALPLLWTGRTPRKAKRRTQRRAAGRGLATQHFSPRFIPPASRHAAAAHSLSARRSPSW